MKEDILDQKNHVFKIDNDQEILLNLPKGVFCPTATTTTLLKAIREYINKPGKILDLGCGCGVIGITLHKMGLADSPLYASDLSRQAIDSVNKNAKLHDCSIVAKNGYLFGPWPNKRFDYIVNDVAGISIDAAKISPWYNDIPCEAGIDGTLLVSEVLKEAPGYLNKGGLFFFPIISLSNVDKILAVAQDSFQNVKKLTHQEWPLPSTMCKYNSILEKLEKSKHIQIEKKFGMIICFTDVYVAYNSNKV